MIEVVASFPAGVLLAFVVSGIVLNLTPGADVMFATASGLGGGLRAGIAAGAGVGLGGIVHVVLAALGVAALIGASPAALELIRWLGAAYLVFLGVQSWRAAGPESVLAARIGAGAAFRRGFLTNVLNPKVILFILAFLPQFTDPARGPVWQQILFLGAIFCVTGMVITAGYGALAGWLGAALARKIGVLNRVAAVVFVALAVRMVLG